METANTKKNARAISAIEVYGETNLTATMTKSLYLEHSCSSFLQNSGCTSEFVAFSDFELRTVT